MDSMKSHYEIYEELAVAKTKGCCFINSFFLIFLDFFYFLGEINGF